MVELSDEINYFIKKATCLCDLISCGSINVYKVLLVVLWLNKVLLDNCGSLWVDKFNSIT